MHSSIWVALSLPSEGNLHDTYTLDCCLLMFLPLDGYGDLPIMSLAGCKLQLKHILLWYICPTVVLRILRDLCNRCAASSLRKYRCAANLSK